MKSLTPCSRRMVQGGVTYEPHVERHQYLRPARRRQAKVAEPLVGATGGPPSKLIESTKRFDSWTLFRKPKGLERGRKKPAARPGAAGVTLVTGKRRGQSASDPRPHRAAGDGAVGGSRHPGRGSLASRHLQRGASAGAPTPASDRLWRAHEANLLLVDGDPADRYRRHGTNLVR